MLTAATYTCPSCSARIPASAIEHQSRHAGFRFIEVARIYCDADDCPADGRAEMTREPPLGDATEREKAQDAAKFAEREHEQVIEHLQWAVGWIRAARVEPLRNGLDPGEYERWQEALRAAGLADEENER